MFRIQDCSYFGITFLISVDNMSHYKYTNDANKTITLRNKMHHSLHCVLEKLHD